MNNSIKSAIHDCLNKMDEHQLKEVLWQMKKRLDTKDLASRYAWKRAALMQIRKALEPGSAALLRVG